MSAIDRCEDETIRAFEKDGWQLQGKPYVIRITQSSLRADAIFERGSNGRREQLIVTEIKCFSDPKRDLEEFYRAIGQYQFYRAAMQLEGVAARLYLTIPLVAYQRFISRPEYMETLRIATVSYVIVDLKREEIVEWKP